MALDNLTLLFSLALTSAVMAFSLAVTSRSGARDGLRLWAAALGCEAAAWTFGALREAMPVMLSVLLANLGVSAAQALKLVAVHQYRGLKWPRWRGLLPVLAMLLLLVWLPVDNYRGRLIGSSLIYAAQIAMIARALRYDNTSRGGRAWWLIYGATLAILPIMALRVVFALHSAPDIEPSLLSRSPNPLQVLVFVGVITLNLLGALGFVLLGKERAEREIRQLAMIDGLTGILNRRALMDSARQEMAAALRNKLPLSLLLLDIDHFKHINDRFGHAAGDTVLVEFGRLVSARLRTQDIFGRYGGEEFCVLLPGTDAKGAMVLAEALRKAVEANTITLDQTGLTITVTIGIGTCPAQCSTCKVDINRILQDADRALYRGKEAGRNRSVMLSLSCGDNETDDPKAAWPGRIPDEPTVR